ncbi:EamA-like transporter family [Bifidobacterium sp. DSM 109958]|uniref:EamA-like transporter family n=1 Tax=Bifidobacterium moraviense TaxID=2675323 RepID=A0A7Y0F011_9BIFI|nr:EamA family transporter [Bifidobacterium sp. DSM 109958]NMM99507.1 EamA-like transporter family [Bifidobacterium sp. DSM 109958]
MTVVNEAGTARRATLERSPRDILVGSVLTLLGGALWGVNGTVSKILMESYQASPEWIACVRQLAAGVLFLVCAAVATPRQLAGAVRDRPSWPSFVGNAVVCVLFVQVAYLNSIDATNSGTATVLQALNLLFVLAYTCIHARRGPVMREGVGVALAFVGVALIATGGDPRSLSLPAAGLMWGMLNAASTAALAVTPLRLIDRWGSFATNGIMFVLSGLAMTPFVRPWNEVPPLDAAGWGLMAFTVLGGTFGAFWLFLVGSLKAGPMRATMLGTIEPVMATVSAVLFTGTVFTPVDLTGFALIIAMVFLVR